MKHAVVCVGDAGINGLATVRSRGRHGVPVHVVALKTSAQIASASRYCHGHVAVGAPGDLAVALPDFGRRQPRAVEHYDAPGRGLVPSGSAEPVGSGERRRTQ